MKRLPLSLLRICLAVVVIGHAPAEQPKEIETRISVLAIGDVPMPRYEIRDDRRHLLDTRFTEHPPTEVLVREKRGGKEAFKTMPLGLNSPTGYITYRGEPNLILFREDADTGRAEFANITLPELRNDLTVFLLRNRASKSWEKAPLVRYFDNGPEAFPNDSIRLINLSTVPIRARINEARLFEVAVRGSTVVRIPRKDQGILSYRIAAVLGEELLPLIDSATTTMPDTRFNLIIYNSDSAHARTPVDVASYFERPLQEARE